MTRGDTHLADDVGQETFLKAWQKLNTYRGGARFSTWLFSIAFNEFRTVARRRKELALEDVDGEPTQAEEPAATGDSHLRMDLAEAMKSLNTNERGAVVLCC